MRILRWKFYKRMGANAQRYLATFAEAGFNLSEFIMSSICTINFGLEFCQNGSPTNYVQVDEKKVAFRVGKS